MKCNTIPIDNSKNMYLAKTNVKTLDLLSPTSLPIYLFQKNKNTNFESLVPKLSKLLHFSDPSKEEYIQNQHKRIRGSGKAVFHHAFSPYFTKHISPSGILRSMREA